MITGELKKIIKNKTFIVIAVVIVLINILTIIYCSKSKDSAYIEYKNNTQQEYAVSYNTFIKGLDERAELLLQSHGKDASEFYKRDIKKTQKDYNGLSDVVIDESYNVGMEEYAGYSYGIFFCILFSFICLEYIYFSEKKNGMIYILRSTKKGRKQMIISKWFVYMLMVFTFAVVQEVITAFCFRGIYSLGNLNASVQSLSLFRDCILNINMFEGILLIIINRLILSLVVGSIIFFCGIAVSGMLKSIAFSTALFVAQYIFYVAVSVSSSFDKLCCMNVFYLWDSEKFIGVYHNLNFFGYPVEKNTAMLVLDIVIILITILTGPIIFSTRYQMGNKKYELKILKLLRRILSKTLHIKSLFLNELYKLLFLQKKWILVAVFIIVIITSANDYIPGNIYQTAYDATYHMYISHIEGELNDNSLEFINEEQEYISTLEKMMEDAVNSGDDTKYMQVEAEYTGRVEAFERLMAQYDKIRNVNDTVYFIDELNFKSIIKKYDRDIIIFMISGIILTCLISGLFASDKENRIFMLSYSTRNGRGKLFRTKLFTGIMILLIVFASAEVPILNGYKNAVKLECFYQKLSYLYDPCVNSNMTLLGLLVVVLILRFVIYIGIGVITAVMAKKTKNEFMTSVFVSTIVIIACLVLYFLKINLTSMLIYLIGR